MVSTQPEGETLREIAARHNRSYDTVLNVWSHHPDWPAPIGKRSRSRVFDPAAVDAVITKHFTRETTAFEPRRLYTAQEIAKATGISAATIRADQSKKRADGTPRWPAPDNTEGPANRWYGATVNTALAGRRGYRRSADGDHPTGQPG
ncbi:hypothetical protein ABTZ57_01380 [Streptomyces sp. NPDC094048]|uniref:hypothetical protein n=1 Tax=unclassified Streptomyces TaxID=2593676 RepID=UPI00331DA04E